MSLKSKTKGDKQILIPKFQNIVHSVQNEKTIDWKQSKAEGEVNWDEENLRVDIAPSACLILLLGGNSDPPIALVDALALLRELQRLVPAQLDVVVRYLPDDWGRRSFWHWNYEKPKLSTQKGIIVG